MDLKRVAWVQHINKPPSPAEADADLRWRTTCIDGNDNPTLSSLTDKGELLW
ncbi:hypothetical protein [Microvirga makkahensis]|uniref:Uncharacterized protein n=1 Tax=Microvirga makkahensis TaxID=1128670 RepID=A0A7X3SPD0_9HYPH|nr:hypothetical protein [Microvirga makkahensis]MXQ12336.1 hypothetical protein [Microvirga makkahensis]